MKSLRDRLLNNREIDPITGCWLWTGVRLPKGYGKMTWGYRTFLVHRLSAFEFLGFDLASPIQIQHKCNNPPCFNPDHFITGDQRQNLQYMSELKRFKGKNQFSDATHCKRGHEFTPENTVQQRSGRLCKICKNLRTNRRRAVLRLNVA